MPNSNIKDASSVLDQAVGGTGLSNASIGQIVGQVVQVALGLLGIVFVILIIYSGFLWMTSAGNEEKVGKAKKILMSSIIGLFIILSAYAITTFVFEALV
ncbi:MAG: pilin [Candidatus Magasanikbacteria bacterium]|nr:pilin [Candidatus Magasanikbacteria bacterium]